MMRHVDFPVAAPVRARREGLPAVLLLAPFGLAFALFFFVPAAQTFYSPDTFTSGTPATRRSAIR